MGKKKSTKREVVGLLTAFVLALVGAGGHATRLEVALLSIGIASCLMVMLSDWALKRGLTIPECIGHTTASLVISFAFAGVYLWYFFPPIRRHALDQEEQQSFEQPLKNQQSPRASLTLACSAYDEAACTYGGQFVYLFRDAGWKVKNNGVERVTLTYPYDGVRIFAYVKQYPDPNAPPNVGVWTRVTPSLITVYRAFHAIGVEPEENIRKDESPEELTVYFGHEKEDEGQPTNLSRMFQDLPDIKQEHPELRLP
jgi:hypothetical protein